MVRSLIHLFCLVFALSFTISASAYTDEQIAKALQWEAKWSKVTKRQIAKYASRMKPALKDVAPEKRKKALAEVRRFMSDRFSWQRQGKHFVKALTKSCDRNVLNKLVDIKRGEQMHKLERAALANQYKQCATPGFRLAMKHLYKVVLGSKPQVDRIINRAKS
jgi:hypothetical protein